MSFLFDERSVLGLLWAFATLSNVAIRLELDTGTAGNDQSFWQSVRSVFITHGEEEFDQLRFADDDIIGSQDLDLADIVPHEWKKLRQIWKGVKVPWH